MFNDSLYEIPDHIQTRWATAENPSGDKGGACRGNDGRKSAPCKRILQPNERFTLAEVTGCSGMIRRIWIALMDRSPQTLRGLRIDMYWDGGATPAVSAPLGDFFCQGLGRMSAFQNALFSNPEGRNFNCCVPMPFRTGMRIEVANESDVAVRAFFYEVDYTLGDRHGANCAYFHAHWRRENPTTLRQDYTILPHLTGRGRYLGVCFSVITDTKTYFNSWFGEGEAKIYLDGDTDHPTLCGTGVEDYIGTSWGQGRYDHAYQGCLAYDNDKMHTKEVDGPLSYDFYRLHVPDPVFFHKDIRVTIQQIGGAFVEQLKQIQEIGGELYHSDQRLDLAALIRDKKYPLFERQDDWSSCAWFYLDRPENGLPALAPVAERIAGL